MTENCRPYPHGLETPPRPVLPADAARQDNLAAICGDKSHLVPRCHPEVPFVSAEYEVGSGVLKLSCAKCGAECIQIAVAPGSQWPDLTISLKEVQHP